MASATPPSNGDADDVWVFPMLEAISGYPDLWDKSDPKYRLVHTVRRTSWLKVADYVEKVSKIKKPVKDLQTRWTTIFNAYKESKKRPSTRSRDGEQRRSKYATALSFLESRSEHRELPADALASDGLNPTAGTPEPTPLWSDTTEDYEDDADAPSTSVAPKRRRRFVSCSKNGSALNKERIIDLLQKAVHKDKAPTSIHDEYGTLVVRALDKLPNPSAVRQQAMYELSHWISTYDNYVADDKAQVSRYGQLK